MMLVLETNGNLLHLFPSPAEAESDLEVIDIENEEYLFYDSNGQRFIAEIIKPRKMFSDGSFRLKPEGEPDKSNVASLLSRAPSLGTKLNGIKNLDDLRKAIAFI